jgi:hypothetical protein
MYAGLADKYQQVSADEIDELQEARKRIRELEAVLALSA